MGHSSTFLFKKSTSNESKINDIDSRIGEKMNLADYKRKSKKLKTKITTDFDDLKLNTEKRLIEMEKKFETKIANFEEMTREVERKTLWKIQDCEDLLKKRTNNEYVDLSVKKIEDKLMKLINNAVGGGSEQYERKHSDLETKVKLMDEALNEKIKMLKKANKDLEDK